MSDLGFKVKFADSGHRKPGQSEKLRVELRPMKKPREMDLFTDSVRVTAESVEGNTRDCQLGRGVLGPPKVRVGHHERDTWQSAEELVEVRLHE